MNPLIISPGLIFDGRSIIISIAGFVGGWVTALIAAMMGIIYRTWIGGPGGIMGVSVIASSAAIGIAYHYIRRRRPHVVTPLHLIGFGIIVHVCMLALTMTLPSGMRYEVFSNIAMPVILIYPLGTLLVCVVLLDLESRIRAEDALQERESRLKSISNNFTAGMIYQVVISPNGSRNFTYLSDSVKQLYGISPEEGMGRCSTNLQCDS
jgi:LytS/YehU family sensor histidine kinase